ncbi:serine hydrolase-like protein [Ixodes scapularis]|uniref:serine hydrolase-like protein n=1 Tax=Ixodes scapularis TaxID=6945 RepID=UPI001A9FC0EC|nr:serine hydrolase-like protein [Ixodes scapularis]
MHRLARALRCGRATPRARPCTHDGLKRLRHSDVSARPTAELKIPVPYGHLAAKEWLPVPCEDPERRMICLHGHQDNAGSFDFLLPKLDARWRAVALDYTGHGLSSHLPKGCAYTANHFVADMVRTVRFLGWQKFCLVGHSMGGALARLYANLFPDQVKKVVMMDSLAPTCRPPSMVLKTFRTTMLESMRIEDKDPLSQPSYTEEQLVQLYMKTSSWGYLPEDAKTILNRGSVSIGDGRFILTKDPRLRAISWSKVDRAEILEYVKAYKNDLLVLNALPGIGFCSVWHQKVLDVCEENCRKFEYLQLEGNHHIHMNQADLVAKHVGRFLEDMQ